MTPVPHDERKASPVAERVYALDPEDYDGITSIRPECEFCGGDAFTAIERVGPSGLRVSVPLCWREQNFGGIAEREPGCSAARQQVSRVFHTKGPPQSEFMKQLNRFEGEPLKTFIAPISHEAVADLCPCSHCGAPSTHFIRRLGEKDKFVCRFCPKGYGELRNHGWTGDPKE